MKILGYHPALLRGLIIATIVLSPGLSTAATRAEELAACLKDFEGIVWKLPYQPRLNIRSCATPSYNYDTGKSVDGRRSVELIGSLILGPDLMLPPEESDVAIESAIYTHFDALFLRQGYRRADVEYSDARKEFNARYYLAHNIPHDTPLPFVSLARYERAVLGRVVRLIYKKNITSANTWNITLDADPVETDAKSVGAK
jgi:hypothetical protein